MDSSPARSASAAWRGAAIGVAKFLFWAGIAIALVLFVLGTMLAKKVS
nr:hypothetical protein [Xanthomonas sacchari]